MELPRSTRFEQEHKTLAPEVMNETIRLQAAHSSVRKFRTTPVTKDQVEAIVTAARSTSSSSDMQTMSLVVVDDRDIIEQIAGVVGQDTIKTAPLFIAFCPDLYRMETICKSHGGSFVADGLEISMVSIVDAAIACQNAAVAAESLGLGICYIGGIRNYPEKVAQLLGLPKHVFALMGLVIGVPDENPQVKPRLPEYATVFHNRYDTALTEKGVKEYETIRPDAKWSERIATRMGQKNPLRGKMKDILAGLGFNLD
jgi:FMN reductase (NADPH)